MKRSAIFLFLLTALVFACSLAYCDETGDIIAQAQEAAKSPAAAEGLIGGFSMPALIGGILFGAFGLYSFGRGKKRDNFWLMAIGVALMAFPYFVRDTLWLYMTGALLCGAFYWKRNG